MAVPRQPVKLLTNVGGFLSSGDYWIGTGRSVPAIAMDFRCERQAHSHRYES